MYVENKTIHILVCSMFEEFYHFMKCKVPKKTPYNINVMYKIPVHVESHFEIKHYCSVSVIALLCSKDN